MRYNLKSETENIDKLVKLWELEFLKIMKKILDKKYKNENESFLKNIDNQCLGNNLLKIDFSVSQSLDIEIEANAQLDTTLISCTFILIIFFAIALMSFNTTWITSPGILLPMAGIMSALFGMLSGFGFLAMIGYKGCSLIFVIPYLLIGIGIDDMFIIYASFTYAYNHRPKNSKSSNVERLADLIGETLLKSGVSITITSITDFVAFIVGLTTGFRSVQIFCVYAAFSIAFCYFYQCTLFSSVLCLHARRIEKKRNAILFCVEQKNLNCLPSWKSKEHSNKEMKCTDNNELENLNDLKSNNEGDTNNSKTHESKNNEKLSIKGLVKKIFRFLICTKIGKLILIYPILPLKSFPGLFLNGRILILDLFAYFRVKIVTDECSVL